jgi:predicted Zn finger-like uncharacterized protein
MKFLCDNCKAKYQIADEKVAGKTVRMKCRKCGHLIEIRATAALAEATAFRSLPSEELSQIMEEPPKAGASVPVAAPKPAPRPAAGTSASPSGAPRRPSPTASIAPRPAAPRAGAGASARAAATARASVPEPEAPAEAATKPGKAGAGGLASAFTKAVASEPPREEAPASTFDMGEEANDEWYAGIGGVPVGPMRLSELRSKMASGQVNEETLVWREGFEEWVALRTVPTLVDVFKALPAGAPKARPVSVKSNVVSLRPEARPAPEDPTAIFSSASLSFGSDAPAAETPKAAPQQAPSDPALKVAPTALADPFAAPGPFAALAAPAATASAPVAPVAPIMPVASSFASDPPPAQPTNRIPPAAWVVVVLAMAVGVLGGTMLVPKEKAKTEVQVVTIEKVVSMPAPDTTAAVVENPTEAPEASTTAKRVYQGPGPKTTATATPGPSIAAVAPPLLTNSPVPTPTNDTATAAATETIPTSKLQEVVSGQRASIRRACWDPMVASGTVSGSIKANVSLSIVAGRVTSVSVAGADGRLSACIQSRVKNWQFPTGFAPTTTSFTLAFVAQSQ